MTTNYDIAYTIAVLTEKRDSLDAQITEYKDLLRDSETQAYVDDSNLGRPALVVKISPNRRIDDKLARENLDATTYQAVSKVAIDTAKARAFLTTEQIESITKTYGNKVEVQVQ